jgi:hypothetical protein
MSKIRKTLIAVVVVVAGGVGALAGTAFAAGQFNDVNENHPFFDDIEWMAETGISEGYQDGTYRPGDPVTRQAMSAFIHRANDYEIEVKTNQFVNVNLATVIVPCPAGTEAISGGGSTNGSNLFMTSSFPNANGSAWNVSFETENNALASFSATANVTCGPVDTGNEV